MSHVIKSVSGIFCAYVPHLHVMTACQTLFENNNLSTKQSSKVNVFTRITIRATVSIKLFYIL